MNTDECPYVSDIEVQECRMIHEAKSAVMHYTLGQCPHDCPRRVAKPLPLNEKFPFYSDCIHFKDYFGCKLLKRKCVVAFDYYAHYLIAPYGADDGRRCKYFKAKEG